MVTNMAAVRLTQPQSVWLRWIQQLRAAGANPTNPPPPFRAAFQGQVTEGGAFRALTKYTGNHSVYHDWSFSARRVLTRADERFAALL